MTTAKSTNAKASMTAPKIAKDVTDLLTRLATDSSASGELVAILSQDIQEFASNPEDAKMDSTSSFLYEQDRLTGKVPLSLTYCLKRLLRGLASTNPTTRANYAACLKSIFGGKLFTDVDLAWEWMQFTLTKKPAGEGAIEETARYAGLLLAFSLFLTLNAESLAEDVAQRTRQIWMDQPNLAFEVLCLLKSIAASKPVKKTMQKCFKDVTLETGANQSKILAFHGLGLCMNGGGKDGSEKITASLIATITPDNIGHAGVKAFVFAVIDCFGHSQPALMQSLMEKLAMRPQVAHSILVDVLPALDEALMPLSLVCDDFVKILEASSPKYSLLDSSLFDDDEVKYALLNVALVSSKKEIAKHLLPKMLPVDAEKINNAASMGPLLLSLMKPGSSFLSIETEAMKVIKSLMDLSLRDNSNNMSEHLQGALFRVVDGKLMTLEALLTTLQEMVPAPRDIEDDGPQKDAWKSALKLEKTLNKQASKKRKASVSNEVIFNAFSLIFKVGKMLLTIDPMASVDIFEDLHLCFETLSGNGEGDVDCVHILVEILIQWLSRSSSFLRLVANEAFMILASDLTEPCFESINKVLLTIPGTEKDDLMEDEEEEEDDSDDDSDSEADDEDEDEADEDHEHHDHSHSDDSEEDGESDDEESLMDESLEDDDVDEPMAKKIKLLEALEAAMGGERATSIEDDDIPLDQAKDEDLEMLDSKLGAIMKARKDHKKSKQMTKQNLIHFKQRLLNWIEMLITDKEDSKVSLKLKMIPLLLDLLQIHSIGKSNEVKKARFDEEIVAKATTIFTSLSKKQSNIPTADIPADLIKKTLVLLAERAKSKDVLVARHISDAFSFIAQLVSHSESDEVRSSFTSALEGLWKVILEEGDKKHSMVYLNTFEDIRSTSPHIFMPIIATPQNMSTLASLRPFSRQKIIKFIEPALKKVDGPHSEVFKAFFISLINTYTEGAKNSGFVTKLNLQQLKDELALVNPLISKSRFVLGSDCSGLWRPLLDTIIEHLQGMSVESKDNKQIDALKSRIKSMMALAQVKK